MRRSVVRSLRAGEPDPPGEPKRYPLQAYIRLRWKVAPYTYVERYERDASGAVLRTEPSIAKKIDYDQMRDLYDYGFTLVEISSMTGWDAGALSRALRRRGKAMRTGSDYAAPVDPEKLRQLYADEGRSLHDTTRLAGIENVVRTTALLRAAGVSIRSPGRPRNSESSPDNYSSEFKRMRPLIRSRSRGTCEARASENCSQAGYHVHHRKARGQGGENSMVNLLDCCSTCHSYIHDHPQESYAKGWLVHGWDDPGEVGIKGLLI